jgi:hypothetical protein
LRGDLMLEQGLLQARLRDGRAAETLRLFLHHFPRDPRAAEAQLAMAELIFEGRAWEMEPGISRWPMHCQARHRSARTQITWLYLRPNGRHPGTMRKSFSSRRSSLRSMARRDFSQRCG